MTDADDARPLRSSRELGALEFCPDFPARAARHEAWWRRETPDGRPLLLGFANRDPGRPITRRLELRDDPDAWLDAKLRDAAQLAPAADALPHLRVDLGACALPGLMGLPREFGSDTAWTPSFINDDWSNLPDFRLNRACALWRTLDALLNRAAAAARGRCLVATPNLGGASDILLHLRGATEICLDVMDQPEKIIAACAALIPAYREASRFLHETVYRRHAGLIHWHLIWSETPYVIAECDLSYSVGPEDWEKVCRPDVARQARLAPRCIFHLDGAGSTRHIEALLRIPEIHAIQFTPGAGAPSALPWLDLFRRIQQAGRSLLIFAPIDEAEELTRALDPAGLALQLEGARDPDHLRTVCEKISAGKTP